MYNILPVSDIQKHLEDSTCECNPGVIFENGEMIIVHNSYDGREYKEQMLNEITKQFLCDDMISTDDLL